MSSTVTYTENFDRYMRELTSALQDASVDIKNDLVNAAKSTAPHKKGDLEKGIAGETVTSSDSISIIVAAAARGSNGYNYASKMHNASYALGQQSQAKGSGYSELTGNKFPVGQKFLQNPAVMSHSAYVKHFEKAMASVKGG